MILSEALLGVSDFSTALGVREQAVVQVYRNRANCLDAATHVEVIVTHGESPYQAGLL